MINYINEKFTPELKTQADEIIKDLLIVRRKIIEFLKDHPIILATWLYADQGERLFNNNNRYLVILVDSNSLIRPDNLKSNFELIEASIKNALDSLNNALLFKIKYNYEKDERHRGYYETTAYLTIIEKPEEN